MDCSLPGSSVHEIFQARVLSGMPLPSPHSYMTTGKSTVLTRWTSVSKVMFPCFNRLVIVFLPRSRHLLALRLQSPSAVILEPKKIKSATVSTVSPSICHEVMGPNAMILVFWMLSFQPTFSLSSFTFIKRLFSSSSLSAIRVVSSAYLVPFSSVQFNSVTQSCPTLCNPHNLQHARPPCPSPTPRIH